MAMETRTVRHATGVTILEIQGTVVSEPEIAELRGAFAAIIEGGGDRLLVDLSEARRMNSSAIGVLVGAYTSYVKRGWQLRFCGITKEMHVLLTITNLRKVFKIDGSREDSIPRFTRKQPH